MRGEDLVRAENTRQFIQQLSAIISEYELSEGDYPPSTFPGQMESKPSSSRSSGS